MTAPTPPARCEPPPELRGVDGWHWVETQAIKLRFIHRWWRARGVWCWADMDESTLAGFRYLSPVATPEEVDALRAERDVAIAMDRNASAAHAKRATDLWLVTEERDNLRAGTDRLVAERTILRARVTELEAALKWMIDNDETNSGDTPIPEIGGQTWDEYNSYWLDGLNKARAALENKP